MVSNDFNSAKTLDYWTYLEENYKEVAAWPPWMRGVCPPGTDKSGTEDLKQVGDKRANGACA
jgi:hypothetical protein